MKKYLLLLASTLLLASACEPDETLDSTTTITYEVLTSSGDWFGEYLSETGEKVCVCAQPLLPGGWTYTFEVADKPFELHIDASSECCSGQEGAPDVTTNIYVNEVLVASQTSNWAPGVASTDYKIE